MIHFPKTILPIGREAGDNSLPVYMPIKDFPGIKLPAPLPGDDSPLLVLEGDKTGKRLYLLG